MTTYINADLVGKASHELAIKSCHTIDKETAIKWGARAFAAFKNSETAMTKKDRLKWLVDAIAYKHEAIEHAASAEFEYHGFLASVMNELEEVP